VESQRRIIAFKEGDGKKLYLKEIFCASGGSSGPYALAVNEPATNNHKEGCMNRVNRVSGWALAGLLLAAAGCTYDGGMTQKSAMTPTLYERLGGKGAITAVVEDFVGRVAADKRINGKFALANIPRLKMLLVEQICAASGGPCTYTGRDMKTAHAGMGITGAQF